MGHYLDQTNIFVKYLPADIDDDGLRNLFEPYGEIISSKVMIDHQTGMSLGYGYAKERKRGEERFSRLILHSPLHHP